MKPKLLIITGPQGSGNHLFSKILSHHPKVFGWKMKTYWEGHHDEPFNGAWSDPSELHQFGWDQHEYIFTSVSCPYIKNKTPYKPRYKTFIETASQYADIKIGIIGRDQNILRYQQTRVRGQSTVDHFQSSLPYLMQFNPLFLSQELYQLYGNDYLQSVSKLLDFPISHQSIYVDANKKYIQDIGAQPLDLEVKRVIDEQRSK